MKGMKLPNECPDTSALLGNREQAAGAASASASASSQYVFL